VPFIGAGAALKRPVWAEDIVDGLLRLANAPVSLGKTYNFSGAEPISMRELAELLLLHHDRPRPIVPLPVWLCRALATVLPLFMSRPPLTSSAIAGIVNDADLDPTSAIIDLGYAPLGVRAGFRRCYPIAAEAAPPSLRASQLAKGQAR